MIDRQDALQAHLKTVRCRFYKLVFAVAWRWFAAWLGPFVVLMILTPLLYEPISLASTIAEASRFAMASSLTFSAAGVIALEAVYWREITHEVAHRSFLITLTGVGLGAAMLALFGLNEALAGAAFGLSTAIAWLTLRETLVHRVLTALNS